ncbi:efflux RND transporter periplasmic adaptor subunit [bacterium]|nr:efflux RND transporter periplasmic adaptor subunit [bacterium]
MTRKRILAAIILVAVIGGGIWFWRKSAAAKAEAEEPETETATVERKDLAVTVSASGVLEPLTTVEVKSRSGGEIKRLFVEAGDVVRAQQLLAQIDPTQIQSKVDQAAATVASGRAKATQAKLDAALQVTKTSTDITKSVAAVEAARASVAEVAEQLRQDRQTTQQAVQQAEASLQAARARYAQAQAEAEAEPELQSAQVASAKAALEAARQNLAKVKAGPRAQEIAQGQAALRNAEAAVRNAEATLKRQRALLEKGFVSRQATDDAQKAYDQAVAQRDSADEALKLLQAGNRPEEIAQAEAEAARAEASLRTANANTVQVQLKQGDVEATRQAMHEAAAALETAKAQRNNVQVRQKQLEAAQASVRQAEAALAAARANRLQDAASRQSVRASLADLRKQTLQLSEAATDLSYTNVYAPRSGVIMQKFVEEGSVVPAGTAALKEGTGIVSIADISQMFVLAEVDEADMAGVKVGQSADVTASVLPDRKLPAHVVKIFPMGQEDQNVVRFQVRVQIDDPPAELRPGMTADVTVHVAERKQVLVVPDTAITRSKGKASVDVMGANGQTETREVQVGLSNWEDTEIVSGLQEGETVVIPPPPGTEFPWMSGAKGAKGAKGSKDQQNQRTKGRMMMQFRNRGR